MITFDWRSERGAVVSTAIIAPGLLLILGLLIFGGRNALAEQAVDQAAASAARAASLARTGGQAQADGEAAANQSLTGQGLDCLSTSVQVNASGFSSPPGQFAQVIATVTCSLALSDLGLPGLPGGKTLTAVAVSPIDTYRERS